MVDNGGLAFKRLFEMIQGFMGDTLIKVIFVIVVLIGARIVQRLSEKAVLRVFSDTVMSEVTLFLNALRWTIWFFAAALIGDFVFGIELGSILTALGVGSLFVSLGMQDLVKNMVAGVEIVTDGLFKVGDHIEIGAYRGEVVDVTWRQTVIRDFDGDPLAIPNALFNTQIATRRDGHMAHRYDFEVEVTPGTDLDEAAARMEHAAAEALDALGIRWKGREPEVRFVGSTAYGSKASVRIFLDDIEQRTQGRDAAMRAIARLGYLSDCTNARSEAEPTANEPEVVDMVVG